MKTHCTYTFDASAQQVTFADYSAINLDAILLITNVTDNINIYVFSEPLKGGTVATNVLTLTYDTTAMDDADKLLIYYDDTLIDAGVHVREPAKVLGYDGSNKLITVAKTIGSKTYTRTLSYTGTNLTGISAWVES
jgi:hypothetical protein